jgi:hypothetical protein
MRNSSPTNRGQKGDSGGRGPPAVTAGRSLLACLFPACLRHPPEEDVCELDLSHRSLHNVPNDIFAYERTLERLHLECNSLRDLPRQVTTSILKEKRIKHL